MGGLPRSLLPLLLAVSFGTSVALAETATPGSTQVVAGGTLLNTDRSASKDVGIRIMLTETSTGITDGSHQDDLKSMKAEDEWKEDKEEDDIQATDNDAVASLHLSKGKGMENAQHSKWFQSGSANKFAEWISEKLTFESMSTATPTTSEVKCKENDAISADTALSLQIFFGPVGAGFAYMDRYDLFEYAWLCLLFPCIFVLVVVICFYDIFAPSKEESGGTIFIVISCFFFLAPICMFVLWFWGIVVIVNKSILDGNGCALH